MRADLGVGDDACVAGADAHDDDRRPDQIAVGALRIGGEERSLVDARRRDWPSVLCDEPSPATPRRPRQHADIKRRPERERRRECRQAEHPQRPARRQFHKPLAGEARAALIEESTDLLLGSRRVDFRIVLGELLGHDEAAADHETREREQCERRAESDAQPLRLMRKAVEGVNRDEGGRGDRRERKQDEHDVLGAPVGGARRDDARLGRLGPRPSPTPDQQNEPREEPVLHLRHIFSLFPRSRQTATSVAAATSHVTMPSGHGPSLPIESPPGSLGCLV